jgi:hypothetical protein
MFSVFDLIYTALLLLLSPLLTPQSSTSILTVHMTPFFLRLLPLVALSVVSGSPIKPKSQTSVSPPPKSPLSRFDKKVIQVFNDAGSNAMEFGECYQLVRNIYRKLSRAAIILPPSRASVQKLLSNYNPTERISRADFVNLARELRQSTLTGLAMSLIIPPAAMIVATQVPDEIWLSLDLWIVDLMHGMAPTMAFPVVNSHGIVNTAMMVCLALVIANTLIGIINTSLWIGEGKEKTVVVQPSVPKHMIPDAEPLEPKLVEQQPHHYHQNHHHPEPINAVDVTQHGGEGTGDSNAFVAPLLLASAMGGVAAFSLDMSSSSSSRKNKVKASAAALPSTSPPPKPKKEPATAAAKADAKKTNKKKSDEDVVPKKDKPPVGRIAAGGAIVGCLQYAATVARFVGVLLP